MATASYALLCCLMQIYERGMHLTRGWRKCLGIGAPNLASSAI
jgi:hypothetical protein